MNAKEKESWFSEHIEPHESGLRIWLEAHFRLGDYIDDVVQDAFVKVISVAETRIIENPKAYLYSVAKHTAIAAIKKNLRMKTVPFEEELNLIPFEPGEHAEASLQYAEDQQLLRQAIEKLPPKCRRIFIMRRIKGMGNLEIAREMGISAHTVSAQLTIGLTKCRRFFEEQSLAERGGNLRRSQP